MLYPLKFPFADTDVCIKSVSMKKQKKPYRENLEVSETSRQEVQGKYSVKSLTVNRDVIHPGTPSGDSVTVGQ